MEGAKEKCNLRSWFLAEKAAKKTKKQFSDLKKESNG